LFFSFENHDFDLELFFEDEAEVRFTIDDKFYKTKRVFCQCKTPSKILQLSSKSEIKTPNSEI
jgi:hypothetical protein